MPQDPKGPNSTHLLTYRPLAIYLRLNQNVLVLIKIYAEAVRTHQHSREAANASFHNRGLYGAIHTTMPEDSQCMVCLGEPNNKSEGGTWSAEEPGNYQTFARDYSGKIVLMLRASQPKS